MLFCRVGGLSPVMHKNEKKLQGEHFPPPTRKGIYAFVWPYVEPFLYMWSERNKKEVEINGFRKFKYDGPLWCHFDQEAKAFTEKGSWIYTDTNHFKHILAKVAQGHRGFLMEEGYLFVRNPYKRGSCSGFTVCRDFLEVYIEGKHLGKIK